jgi:DnaK suppressor protein
MRKTEQKSTPQAETRHRLETAAARLEAMASALGAGRRSSIKDAIGSGALLDGESTDFAAAMTEQLTDEALEGFVTVRMNQIERALERVRSGGYGLCEDCGEPISPERLEWQPEATRCVGCQAVRDRRTGAR